MTERLKQIDIMQGLAMILVVAGHHLFPFMPMWYGDLHYYIYLYHMPFFIFISGFLIRYSYHGVSSWQEYSTYIIRKVKKFFLPYFLVGSVIIALNHIESPELIIYQLWLLVTAPINSDATFLWYIYLLLILYVISPLIFFLPKKIMGGGLICSVLLSNIHVESEVLCLRHLLMLFPFYFLGVIVADNYPLLKKLDKSRLILGGMISMLVFLLLSILHFNVGWNPMIEVAVKWISLPALTYLAWMLSKTFLTSRLLTFISVNCFGIYLLHMFFVHAIALFVKQTPLTETTTGTLLYFFISILLSILASSYCWRLYCKFSSRI